MIGGPTFSVGSLITTLTFLFISGCGGYESDNRFSEELAESKNSLSWTGLQTNADADSEQGHGYADNPSAYPSAHTSNSLQTDEVLTPGQWLSSKNDLFRFRLQRDGNLVLKNNASKKKLWASKTNQNSPSHLVLQRDGNLALYSTTDQPFWSSQTEGTEAQQLRLNNDGSLVLYCNGKKVWSVNEPSSKKPNIVFIFADDLGYGDLASYGHPYAQTPNLDKLASEGTRFQRFYVTGVTCSPSRTGFLTSRHPAGYANYMPDFGFQDRKTITEILKSAGYATGHFGKWHIGKKNSAKDGAYGIDDVEVIGGGRKSPQGRDIKIFNAAIRFIEDNQDKPFYVNVWGHATHTPVDPAKSLAKIFKNVKCDRDDFSSHMQSRFDDCEEIGGNIIKSMRNYLGDVYGLDNGVGRLLDKIDELGLKDNTIVVFSSDQGPAPIFIEEKDDPTEQNMLGYAGGLRGTKHTQYEGGVRSPFIIRWPEKVPAGKVNRTSIFSGMDWLPTLVSIVGTKIDKSWFEGEDVSDIWLGANRSRTNPLFWRTSSPKAQVSMLQDNWKIHVKGNDVKLYDLSTDEAEKKNVASKKPNIVEKLLAKVNKWRRQLPKIYAKGNDKKLNDPVKKPIVIGPADLP